RPQLAPRLPRRARRAPHRAPTARTQGGGGVSEPIVYADTWRRVMEAAGWRCQCTGQCGNTHTKTEHRCGREHDQYGRGGVVRLTAAPADPSTDPLAAARLPVGELRAWCSPCRTQAARAERRTSQQAPDTGQLLFDL